MNDEITGVDDVTGVKNEDDTQNNNTTNNIQRNQNITGVCQNDVNKYTGAIQNPKQTEYKDNQDDDLSIENESHDDVYVSINDLNTVEQITQHK